MVDELLGVLLGGRYVPRSALGAGGNARVYLADDYRTGGSVALKVLHETRRDVEGVARLEREGRIAGTLNHPNVCRVTDMGQLADSSPFIVMELLVGESLATRISRVGRFAIDEAVDIVFQVLAGLSAAHRRGIVHRDVTPANVFLTPVGPRSTLVKVIDFGGALAEDGSAPEGLPLTAAGIVVGTPLYMTPEQAQGSRVFDSRTDIFVCGTILYQMLTGQPRFQAPNLRKLMEAVAFRSPPPIPTIRPEVPPGLVAVVEQAMARDRALRFATAEAFQEAMLHGAASAAPPLSAPGPSSHDQATAQLPNVGGDDAAWNLVTTRRKPVA
jgi:eukaryotic-like serine/threonine-protein kinase